jgi:hypothetical protein
MVTGFGSLWTTGGLILGGTEIGDGSEVGTVTINSGGTLNVNSNVTHDLGSHATSRQKTVQLAC